MRHISNPRQERSRQFQAAQRTHANRRSSRNARPAVAYRQRGVAPGRQSQAFNAIEMWHEPEGLDRVRFVVENSGEDYVHPATVDEVDERISQLPSRFLEDLETVQFSRMTRKRSLFPCYGMQWGATVYLYPIEKSLVETYVRPPKPQQIIEARMFGGQWSQEGRIWRLTWTESTIKDFYLNNVLIHEIGHINDQRNTSFEDRERYANWFAIEYGFRASRGRR